MRNDEQTKETLKQALEIHSKSLTTSVQALVALYGVEFEYDFSVDLIAGFGTLKITITNNDDMGAKDE